MSHTRSRSRRWWPVALGASLLSIIYTLVLSLPLEAAMAVGLGIFLLVLLHNPALWLRRCAGSCFASASALALAPNLDFALNTSSTALLLRSGGAQTSLSVFLGLLGALLVFLEIRTSQADELNKPSEVQTPAVHIGGDFVAGDKHEHRNYGHVSLALPNTTVGGIPHPTNTTRKNSDWASSNNVTFALLGGYVGYQPPSVGSASSGRGLVALLLISFASLSALVALAWFFLRRSSTSPVGDDGASHV